MSYLLADIDATCSSLGNFDGNLYYISDDSISSLKVSFIKCLKFQEFHENSISLTAFDLDFASR
jgi:hypothetical protein